MKNEVIKIEGMHCMHCVNNVKNALLNAGAITAEVSLEEGLAKISFNDDISLNTFVEEIEDLGFDVVK